MSWLEAANNAKLNALINIVTSVIEKEHFPDETEWETVDDKRVGMLVFSNDESKKQSCSFCPGLVSDNRVDLTSVYGRLPRQLYCSSATPCNLEVKNEKLQAVVTNIWEGNFVMGCIIEEEELNLHIPFWKDEPSLKGLACNFLSFPPKNSDSGPYLIGSIYSLADNDLLQKEIDSELTSKIKDALQTRIFYHLVRDRGHELPWNILMALRDGITGQYRERKRTHEECLEILMIVGDIMINFHHLHADFPEEIFCHLTVTGQVLEALDRVEQAANLYFEIGQVYAPLLGRSDKGVHAFLLAGHAFKTVELFEQAEHACLKALQQSAVLGGTTWDMNDDLCHDIFGTIAEVHLLASEPDPFHALFWSVLSCAGLKPRDGEHHLILTVFLDRCGRDNKIMIKPFFQAQERARSALLFALKNFESACEFREEISKVADKTKQPEVMMQKGGAEFKAEKSKILQRVQKRVKKSVKGNKTGGWLKVCYMKTCNVRETEDKKLFVCPCHSVYYCSKACQLADWSCHKLECSHHLFKKNATTK